MNTASMLYDSTEFENIRDVIDNSVKSYGSSAAFILKEKNNFGIDEIKYKKITYDDFQQDINNLGTALLSLGYGDKRTAIIGDNSYYWIVGYFAVLNGVGICVPLDKGLPLEEIELSLIRSKADIIIYDKNHESVIDKIKERGKTQLTLYISMEKDMANMLDMGNQKIAKGNEEYRKKSISPDDISLLLFTSGTTTLSKAVMLSHRNLASNVYALSRAEKVSHGDVYIALLPLHHTLGAMAEIFMLSRGATTVFSDGLKYLSKNLQEYKVNIIVGVPMLIEAIYKKILSQAEKEGKLKTLERGLKVSKFLKRLGIDIRRKLFKDVLEKLGGPKLIVSGASALDKNVSIGFNAMGVDTVQGYGLTETSPVLSAENIKYLRPGSIGVPLCNVDIKIVDKNDEGIGEIVAKGPNIMLGYYEDKAETDKVIIDGWFHTGDLGYIDEDGYLFISGRKKNVIVLKSGKKVFPEEAELLINELPYVIESMVYPIPKKEDFIIGAEIVYDKEYMDGAFDKISDEERDTFIEKDIERINTRMPSYKRIKRIVVTDEPIIKTTTAKIKRHEEIQKLAEKEK